MVEPVIFWTTILFCLALVVTMTPESDPRETAPHAGGEDRWLQ